MTDFWSVLYQNLLYGPRRVFIHIDLMYMIDDGEAILGRTNGRKSHVLHLKLFLNTI